MATEPVYLPTKYDKLNPKQFLQRSDRPTGPGPKMPDTGTGGAARG